MEKSSTDNNMAVNFVKRYLRLKIIVYFLVVLTVVFTYFLPMYKLNADSLSDEELQALASFPFLKEKIADFLNGDRSSGTISFSHINETAYFFTLIIDSGFDLDILNGYELWLLDLISVVFDLILTIGMVICIIKNVSAMKSAQEFTQKRYNGLLLENKDKSDVTLLYKLKCVFGVFRIFMCYLCMFFVFIFPRWTPVFYGFTFSACGVFLILLTFILFFMLLYVEYSATKKMEKGILKYMVVIDEEN